MSGGDEAKRVSALVAADWEGTVDAAIRIHERISFALEALKRTCAAAATDCGNAERATKSTVRDAEKAAAAHAI